MTSLSPAVKVIASTDLEDFEGGSVQETHDTHTHTHTHLVIGFAASIIPKERNGTTERRLSQRT